MVIQTEQPTVPSQVASEDEILAAQAEEVATIRRQRIKDGERIDAPAETREGTLKPLQYRIAPSDEGSWVMVWELKIDANGEVYGEPTRAPRQQLGLWLQKKRQADGGPRFTYEQPGRIKAEPQFKCLIQSCPKGLYTRFDLVEHVEATHERESRMYRGLLDKILGDVANDNPRVKELAETYAQMEDKGLVSMPVSPVKREEIDTNLGAPVVQHIGITKKEPHVTMQDQPESPALPTLYYCTIGGCTRFFDTPQAVNMHVQNGHKGHKPAEPVNASPPVQGV